MKLRELIVMEDGEAAVATTSSDIATVAYPLFVRGKNKKEKRKNARAAVGQKYVPGPKGIGQGVFEGVGEYVPLAILLGLVYTWYKNTKQTGPVFKVLVNGKDVSSKFLTKAEAVHIIKQISKQEHDTTTQFTIVDSRTNNIVFRRTWIDNSQSDVPQWVDTHENVEEAHVLNHDNVIYRLDRENPMSDTEVAVLGGAGRYSLKALRDKARREAAALAQDLSIEHGGAFRRSAENIKQLTNTINTIVAAYNELARLRRKGGRGSRGITDEDANFIRECIRVVEQATQNYRLMEGLTQEPDPQGYVKDVLTTPKYTIVVNTPGDLDWYKVGTYWNNKVIDPHEFGQDDSDTVLVAQGAEEYKEMLAKIKQMGLTYKTIGGTTDQPEIHDKP